jgi:nicotinate dehydrogenase subunit A
MAQFQLNVNGKDISVDVDSDTPLLYVLRDDAGLHGPKFGCGLGQCGACTVHMDGVAVRSCILPVSAVNKARIVTLEGLGTIEHPHPVQAAFIEEQAAQCGYCINGMIMQASAFLDKTPNPSEAQIREALDANLCRCGTHTRIVKAVQRAAAATVAKGA